LRRGFLLAQQAVSLRLVVSLIGRPGNVLLAFGVD